MTLWLLLWAVIGGGCLGAVIGHYVKKEVFIDDPEKAELQEQKLAAWKWIQNLQLELEDTKRKADDFRRYSEQSRETLKQTMQEVIDIQARSIAKLEADLEGERAQVAGYVAEVAQLRAWIEAELQTPGYAVMVRKADRHDVVRRLAAEGWSKRKIERHLWGYVGGAAHVTVNRALNTALVIGRD